MEMRTPEEVLPPPLWKMAKGQEPLPKTFQETRRDLHEQVKAGESINVPQMVEQIRKVNLPARQETVKDKTRALTAWLTVNVPKGSYDDARLHSLMESLNYLATDWVYSDALEWEGSLAWKHVEKIKGLFA